MRLISVFYKKCHDTINPGSFSVDPHITLGIVHTIYRQI